eukprot:2266005-Alexandrium_andersonii.AAC.1
MVYRFPCFVFLRMRERRCMAHKPVRREGPRAHRRNPLARPTLTHTDGSQRRGYGDSACVSQLEAAH